jgi:hypothetical protein
VKLESSIALIYNSSLMDAILDDPSAVRGIIYCVEHIASGKKYVGQTRSHRLNHGRYRPFGAEGRFRSHMSEAVCNTKHKSGHLLGVDVRKDGSDAFRVSTLETCEIDQLDEREMSWIETLNTIFPAGYNLSPGGHEPSKLPVTPNPTPLAEPKQRGGCTHRSDETRAKMSERTKVIFNAPEARAQRSQHAAAQHAAEKALKFANSVIDLTNLDQYISSKGSRIVVRVGDKIASFAGIGISKEENIKRAKEFLSSIIQTATLPNCSGNP